MRQLAALVGGGQQLLGEGVALGAGDDLVRQRRQRRSAGPGRQQRGQLLVLERSQLQHQRRARASDAVGQPAHPRGRGGLVRAEGRQQQHPLVAEVVGEEDDQVERGVSAQCRSSSTSSRGAAAARSCSSASVSWNTRSCEPAACPSVRGKAPSGRRASTNGWNGSSVPASSIECPSRASNPAPRARAASSDASRVLPMPASPVTSAVVPPPARVASRARPSCPSSGTRPTNTSRAEASIQAVSRRRPRRGRRAYASGGGRIRRSAAKDTTAQPMRPSPSTATIRSP